MGLAEQESTCNCRRSHDVSQLDALIRKYLVFVSLLGRRSITMRASRNTRLINICFALSLLLRPTKTDNPCAWCAVFGVLPNTRRPLAVFGVLPNTRRPLERGFGFFRGRAGGFLGGVRGAVERPGGGDDRLHADW